MVLVRTRDHESENATGGDMSTIRLRFTTRAARTVGALALVIAAFSYTGAAWAECVPGTTVHGKCTQAPPPPPKS